MALQNDSGLAICSITACFERAYRVDAKATSISSEHPLEPDGRVIVDAPACGDDLQATRCDSGGFIPVPVGPAGSVVVVKQ